MHEESLEKLGLTNLEARVYLSLLRLGPLGAGEITKNTGIHRRNVYDSLSRLLEKGFVSYSTINNRKSFQAAPPSRMLEYLGEKQELLMKEGQQIKKLLPELESLSSKKLESTSVRVFTGKEGIRSVMNDVLKGEKELLGFGADAKLRELVNFYLPVFTEKRIQKKIVFKIIYNEGLREKARQVYGGKAYTDVRFLPKEYTLPAVTWVYGNKVAIRPSEESLEDTTIIVLENPKIANSFRKYFELLWKIAKP